MGPRGPTSRTCARCAIWADLFERIEVCGPAGEGRLRGNVAPYERENILWRPFVYSGLESWRGRILRATQLPAMMRAVMRTIRGGDLVLLRSPSHEAFVGAVLVRLVRRESVTKWAGLNSAFRGEHLTEKLQRHLEGLGGRRHIVLVYGQPTRPNQVSFLPALMSAEELTTARRLACRRRAPPPWRFLAVGRHYWDKGFDLALRGFGRLQRERPELDWQFTLVGDGPLSESLRRLAVECGISNRVSFAGALRFEDVQPLYATAHAVVMPGVMEGFPKVIVEAWAHGALPVAASSGLVPWILRPGSGVLFEASPEGLADALGAVCDRRVSLPAVDTLAAHAAALSLEAFEQRLSELLSRQFALDE